MERNNLSPEDQIDFQKQQLQIYPDIAKVLIPLVPQGWNSLVLRLDQGDQGINHSILSDEGHKDVVFPPMELFEHTRKLELLFKKYESMFESVNFRIMENTEKKWAYTVEFVYPT